MIVVVVVAKVREWTKEALSKEGMLPEEIPKVP